MFRKLTSVWELLFCRSSIFYIHLKAHFKCLLRYMFIADIFENTLIIVVFLYSLLQIEKCEVC